MIWVVNAAFVAKMRTIDASAENPRLEAVLPADCRKLTGR
jgi:hypothetical protein